jgi:hypothetical protein
MKRLALVLAFLFLAQTAFASSYLIYKSDTKEVYSLSNEDDATLLQGFTKVILKEDLGDIQLQYAPTDYKYDGKFIVNIKKISDEAIAQQKAEEQRAEEKLIQERVRKIAKDQLITEGIIKEKKDK